MFGITDKEWLKSWGKLESFIASKKVLQMMRDSGTSVPRSIKSFSEIWLHNDGHYANNFWQNFFSNSVTHFLQLYFDIDFGFM